MIQLIEGRMIEGTNRKFLRALETKCGSQHHGIKWTVAEDFSILFIRLVFLDSSLLFITNFISLKQQLTYVYSKGIELLFFLV